ncbi:serine/threonine kinase [Aureococcus anophagefferens]|nr:serine/threonine kinase [Aureococcus anophagefferens]
MTTVKLDAGPKVVVKKGISMRAGINAFGYGTLVGGAAGFAAGFTLAQAIYSDEMERKAVKRTAKITAIACGGARRRRHRLDPRAAPHPGHDSFVERRRSSLEVEQLAQRVGEHDELVQQQALAALLIGAAAARGPWGLPDGEGRGALGVRGGAGWFGGNKDKAAAKGASASATMSEAQISEILAVVPVFCLADETGRPVLMQEPPREDKTKEGLRSRSSSPTSAPRARAARVGELAGDESLKLKLAALDLHQVFALDATDRDVSVMADPRELHVARQLVLKGAGYVDVNATLPAGADAAKVVDFADETSPWFLSFADLVRAYVNSTAVGAGDDADEAAHEALLLEKIDHPHVRRTLGDRAFFLPEAWIWRAFAQICGGLEHLHAAGVVHRDIKALNVLVSPTTKAVWDEPLAPPGLAPLPAEPNLKLADLGVSRQVSENTQFLRTMYGTPLYASPELCEGRPYNEKTDIWSLGVLLYELCALAPPFGGSNLLGLARNIAAGRYEPLSDHYSPLLRTVVAHMLRVDHAERPSIARLARLCRDRDTDDAARRPADAAGAAPSSTPSGAAPPAPVHVAPPVHAAPPAALRAAARRGRRARPECAPPAAPVGLGGDVASDEENRPAAEAPRRRRAVAGGAERRRRRELEEMHLGNDAANPQLEYKVQQSAKSHHRRDRL